MTGRGNVAGFTLVELLVSLTLLSLMLIYSVSAFTMLKDLERVSDEAQAQHEVVAASRHMSEALSDARVWFEGTSAGQPRLLFQGSQQEIRFVSVSGGDRETGGIYALRYFVDDDRQLVVERTLLQEVQDKARYIAVLLKDVSLIRFAYAARPDFGSEPAFADEWLPQGSLPFVIRISADFVEGDRRTWPETDIRIRAVQ